MKTKKELIELRNLYLKRLDNSYINIADFQGKVSEQDWIIQGNVLLLDHLLEDW